MVSGGYNLTDMGRGGGEGVIEIDLKEYESYWN